MKRKHSETSSHTGYQLISKFFKTSERQDVSNATKVMPNSDKPENSPPKLPILQRLTKLREVLSKSGGLSKNTPKNENKKEKLDDEEPLNGDKIVDKCRKSENTPMEYDNIIDEESAVSLSSEDTSCSKMYNTNARELNNDINFQSNNLGSENDFTDIEADVGKDIIDNNEPEMENLDIDDIEQKLYVNHSIEQTDTQHSYSEVMNDSEQSLMDRNTEGNLGDDEDEPETSDQFIDDVHEIRTNQDFLQGLSNKISVMHNQSLTNDSEYSQENCERNDSQESDDENDSDSDDDLLTPPSFLYENNDSKSKLETLLRTPDKLTTPVGASPLSSPVKPARDMKLVLEDKKYKFSLEQMLKDRIKKEDKNVKLSKMEADLDAGIKKGGVKTMTIISEDDTDTDIDDGKDLSQCNLPQEVSRHLVQVSNFSDQMLGEDIFPGFNNCTLINDLPELEISSLQLQDDHFVKRLVSLKPYDVRELICGGWFMQYYLKRPCPPAVAEWVFHIMTCYPDVYLSHHCFKTLWALLRAAYQECNGIPKGIRGMNWVPNIKNVMYVLQYYGATMETLLPKQVMSSEPMDLPIKEDKNHIRNSSNSQHQLVFVMKQLVQFLTHSLHYAPCNYMENDLPQLIVTICRMSLDLRLKELLFELENCIAEILNCFGSAQWEEQVKNLPLLLVNITTNHRNLLHIMQVLPPSPRGSKLRQLTCVTLIRQFVKECKDSTDKQEGLQGLRETAPFEIPELSSLVEEIKPKQNSCDYHLLHTIISLIDLAIGNEDYSSSKREDLKTLASKLRSLNGEIKDPRAKFLDRTKVKDLLVRTTHKIKCLVDSIEPPKERELTSYFEVNSSDYVVQQLVESTIAPSNEEASSPEIDNASSPEGSRMSTPDPLSEDEDPLTIFK